MRKGIEQHRLFRPNGTFHALTYRNFRLFFVGQLVSVAGSWMQIVAQNWLVWQITRSTAWLGIVTGAGALPFLVFTFLGGRLADSYPRRSILVVTQTLLMVLAFLMALIASKVSPVPLQAWMIAVIAAITGAVTSVNMPAQQAFVTEMVEHREAIGNAIALNSLRFNIARAMGPALAGFVLVRGGAALCFLLNGLSFIAVIISLLMMRLPPFEPRPGNRGIIDGVRYIRSTAWVAQILVLVFVSSLLIWQVTTLFPALAGKGVDGPRIYSYLMVSNGVGSVIAGFALAGWEVPIRNKLSVTRAAALSAVFVLLIGVVRGVPLLIVAVFCSGVVMTLFGIGAQTRVQRAVPDSLRGRVMAIYTLLANGRYSLGGLEIGPLAQIVGVEQAIVFNSILSLLIVALVALVSGKSAALSLTMERERALAASKD